MQTPQGDKGEADLTWVLAAAKELGGVVPPNTVVINKSPVPVGSAGRVAVALGRDDVTVASNPEFLREGTAVADCLSPDRIVVGAPDRAVSESVACCDSGITAPGVLTAVNSAAVSK